jgi:fucose permease
MNEGNVTHNESSIFIPYSIFGGSYTIMGVIIFICYRFDRTNVKQLRAETFELSINPHRIRFEWFIVILLSIYIVLDVSIESCMSQMLSVFVVNNTNLNFDKSSASYLIALFWGMYTTGRLIAIALSFKVKPIYILIGSQMIAFCGAAILTTLGSQNTIGVWIGTAVVGFGLAPLYGTSCAWAVRYIQLKYVHMSMVLVASCIGQMSPPFIVGPWAEKSNYVFTYVVAGLIISQTINMIVMYAYSRGKQEIYQNDIQDGLIENVGGDSDDRD